MKVAVAVLSYNRLGLWERTVASLQRTKHPFALVLYDNGSTDGTERRVAELGGICNTSGNHWIGHGFREAVQAALATKPELIVFTGDDYVFRSWWLERLTAFWAAAPADVAIASLSISEMFRWNGIERAVTYGGQRGLVRASVPGASWSFRASLWPTIASRVPDDAHAYDKRVGNWLRSRGKLLCELNLAEHTGREQRAWTSRAYPDVPQVDFEKWGLR